jgi:hypothetical protein
MTASSWSMKFISRDVKGLHADFSGIARAAPDCQFRRLPPTMARGGHAT